ncbi:MAG TPA: YciI family protein [Microlunatus sp.]|nr:YciI family protein [Microlunatus sp.]
MAQYAVLIYASDSSHGLGSDTTPDNRYAEELERSGAMVAAWALDSRRTARSVRGDLVTDGPFLEAKEVVAGFYVLEAPDLDAAVDLARRNPACRVGGGVEVRPVAAGGAAPADAG